MRVQSHEWKGMSACIGKYNPTGNITDARQHRLQVRNTTSFANRLSHLWVARETCWNACQTPHIRIACECRWLLFLALVCLLCRVSGNIFADIRGCWSGVGSRYHKRKHMFALGANRTATHRVGRSVGRGDANCYDLFIQISFSGGSDLSRCSHSAREMRDGWRSKWRHTHTKTDGYYSNLMYLCAVYISKSRNAPVPERTSTRAASQYAHSTKSKCHSDKGVRRTTPAGPAGKQTGTNGGLPDARTFSDEKQINGCVGIRWALSFIGLTKRISSL